MIHFSHRTYKMHYIVNWQIFKVTKAHCLVTYTVVGGILVLSYRERTVPAAHFHFQGLKGWQTGFGTKSSSPNFSIKLTDSLRLNPESFWDNHLWRYPLTRSHFTKPLHKHKDARGQHSVQKPLSICLCIGSRYEQLPARSMWNSQAETLRERTE